MTTDARTVRAIESAAADALPALERVDDDGWRLRFNQGVTRRGNSVLAEHPGRDAVAAKIERAEAFYRKHGAAARFQLTEASEPAGLKRALTERGYRPRPGALVQTAMLKDVAAADAASSGQLSMLAAPGPGWLEALGRGSGDVERALQVRARNLAAVEGPKAFVAIVVEGAVAAVGFAAAAGPWVGLFNMATVPAWRRSGMARRVVAALAGWGWRQGATHAYLQVHPDNVAAQALYASLGFTTHHHYDYWQVEDG